MKYLLLILPLAFFSCQGYGEHEISLFDQEIQKTYGQILSGFEKSDSGVYYKVMKEGTGKEIQYGDIISVSYKGSLIDKTVFELQKEPIDLPLKLLIPAWKEVLIGQKEKVKIQLITPPQMAYGSGEREKIPPSSVLFFEIEVHNKK
ncbi:MAG: peptidyl-prolyl cis-trans isomerase A (cyclophilin A) [Lentimonas sp.]|jgi:peptidyl-prolyl cis-trans isomerase A (cyclophilin A)